MSDLYIEARLQAIKDIASASCQDKKDVANILSFCDEIHEKITEIRNKAIDDFAEMARKIKYQDNALTDIDLDYIVEQLKAGGENE